MKLSRYSKFCEGAKKSDSYFLSNAPWFPKGNYILEGSQAWPVCPSGKNNTYKKMSMDHWWNDTDRGKWNARRKTCPNATLSTSNLIPNDLGSKPRLRGDRPANNCVNSGTARIRKLTSIRPKLSSPYSTVNTPSLIYKNQSINVVYGNNRCLFWDRHKTHPTSAP